MFVLLSASYLHRWGLFCPSGRAPGHRGSQDANSFPKPDWYLEKERDSTDIYCQHGLLLIIIIATIYPPPDLHLISPDLLCCPSCLSKAWAHAGRETCWRLGAPVLPCLYLYHVYFIWFTKFNFLFLVFLLKLLHLPLLPISECIFDLLFFDAQQWFRAPGEPGSHSATTFAAAFKAFKRPRNPLNLLPFYSTGMFGGFLLIRWFR